MSQLFIKILKKESELLSDMIKISEKLRKALIQYNNNKIIDLTNKQEQISNQLNELELKRINFLQNWLQISKSEAQTMNFSKLLTILNTDDTESEKLFKELSEKISRVNSLNSLNRVLANRARYAMNEILSFFSGDKNIVCNVKV